MNILLINPPKTRRPSSGYISPVIDASIPLGLLQIASLLEKNKYKVKVIDCLGDKSSKLIPLSENEFRYTIPEEELKKKIKEFGPDFVGVSSQFSAQLDNVIWITNLIKQVKDIPVAVGGTSLSDDMLDLVKNEKTMDYLILGEGEFVVLDLIKYLEGKLKIEDVKGLIYKKNNELIRNEKKGLNFKLDELPLPAYHLIDVNYYLELPKKGIHYRIKDFYRSIMLSTSRGCPENCSFCAVHVVSGKVWRGFSDDYVVRHIKLLVEEYGVEQIHIEDDNFTFDMNRAKEICKGIIKEGLKFRWDTPNGVRADRLDKELVSLMKEAGCTRLTIAPEVGNQEVLDKIVGKRLSLEKVVEVSRICKEVGMPLVAFFVIGFPGETKKNIRETIDFAKMLMKKYNVIVGGAMHATPFFGTRLYKEAKEKGYLTEEVTPEKLGQSLSGQIGLIRTEEFTPDDLKKFNKQLIRATFYHSAKRYIKNPRKLIKRFNKFYLIKGALIRFIKGADV